MEALTQAKNEYLLEAGLDTLHSQSIAWLSDIAFLQDEAKFFRKILSRASLRIKTKEEQAKLEQLQNRLLYYNEEVLPLLKSEITLHEKQLSRLIEQPKGGGENKWRSNHVALADKISGIDTQFKEFKKELFQLVEQLNWELLKEDN